MFAALPRMSTVEFVWLKHVLPCDSIQTYLWRSLGIDIIFSILSALFQWSRFVWINPFLVVLRLTWFKVCFIFQIVETLSTNDWFATYTKTLNQFLLKIIAKSSLNRFGDLNRIGREQIVSAIQNPTVLILCRAADIYAKAWNLYAPLSLW